MLEEDVIKTLLQVTENSYEYCLDISKKRYTNILAELTLWKLAVPNQTSFLSIRKYTQDEINTLEKIRRLHYFLNSPSFTMDSNEVDSIVPKIVLNMTHLSNVKEMLKLLSLFIKDFINDLVLIQSGGKIILFIWNPREKGGGQSLIFLKLLTMHGRKVEIVVCQLFFSREWTSSLQEHRWDDVKKKKKKNKHDSQLL